MRINTSRQGLSLTILLVATTASWLIGIPFYPPNVDAAPKSEKSATIAIATWPGFAPAFVAKEKKFFGDINIDIKVVDDFSARRAAFKGGQAEFTIYTVDSLAFDVAAGIEGVAILALDQSTGADGIISRAPIKNAADLKGKKIAFTQGSPSHFLLAHYLKNAGLQLSSITSVNVDDPTRAAQAFSGRQVDAAVTWEPNLSELKKEPGVVTLFTSKDAPNLIVDVLVASSTVVRDRPEVVQAVVNGWLKAVDYFKEHKLDAEKIMAKGLGLSETELSGMMPGLALKDRAENKRLFPTLVTETSEIVKLFKSSAQLWKDEGLAKTIPDARRYFSSSFVQKSR